MEFSLAEIDAVSRKATRGAGFSWGLSEEAGKAVRYLCALQLPGSMLLAGYLSRLDRSELRSGPPDISLSPWSSAAGFLCPLSTGAAIADLIATISQHRPLQLAGCASPLLMAAITSSAVSRQGVSLCFQWDKLQLTIHPRGVDIDGSQSILLEPLASEVVLQVVPASEPQLRTAVLPAEVDEKSWQQLNELAFRTYVPSSHSSRAGAGSSLSDND